MKKVIPFIIIAVIVIGLFVFFKGHGGFGMGTGSGEGTAYSNENESSTGTEEREKSNLIVVKITEDKVTIQDKDVTNKEELRKYIEDINNDEKTYKVVLHNAILASYNWVKETFDELHISFEEVEE